MGPLLHRLARLGHSKIGRYSQMNELDLFLCLFGQKKLKERLNFELFSRKKWSKTFVGLRNENPTLAIAWRS